MVVNALLKLLMDLLLLLELFLGDRCQVSQAADLDLVLHELGVTLGEHLHSFHKFIIDTDFVFKSASVAVVEDVNLLSLLLQVDFEVHSAVNGLLNLLLLFRNLSNLLLLVRQLVGENGDTGLELLELILVQLCL